MNACKGRSSLSVVMVALVATIHDFFGSAEASGAKKDVDGRHRADHDDRVNVYPWLAQEFAADNTHMKRG
jgi:hypothetical protein